MATATMLVARQGPHPGIHDFEFQIAEHVSSSETDQDEATTLIAGRQSPGGCFAGWSHEIFDVESSVFNVIVGVVIILNIALQGMETFYGKLPPLEALEMVCTSVFMMEMILRIRFYGCQKYLSTCSRWFDTFLVSSAILNQAILPMLRHLHMIPTEDLGVVGFIVSCLRSFRIFRVVRLFTIFNELNILLSAFGEAMKTVMWIGVIGLVVDYMYAVTMVNLAHQMDWGEDEELIHMWFGDLWKSMRTFFIIMTLAEWDQVALVLEKHMHPALVYAAALLYILTTAFSLVSLITGVLSDKLISAQMDNRELARQLLDEEQSAVHEELQMALRCFDRDGDGRISSAEVRNTPEQEVHTALLDLQRIAQITMTGDDFLGFIELVIDKMGETGQCDTGRIEVSLEALVDALQSSRGPAQAHNLWKLSSTVHKVRRQVCRSEERISGVESKLSSIEGRLGGIDGKLDRLCEALPAALNRLGKL